MSEIIEPEVTTPKADAPIVVFTEQTMLDAISAVQIQEKTLAHAQDLLTFIIKGVDDREGYKTADTKRARIRDLRLKVQKRAKELKDQANEFKKRIDTEADRITGILGAAEDHLKGEIARIDNVKEEAKRAEAKRRQELLIGAGFKWNGSFFIAGEVILAPDKLLGYSDDELAQHIEAGKREVERIAAERAEIDRLKREAEIAASLNSVNPAPAGETSDAGPETLADHMVPALPKPVARVDSTDRPKLTPERHKSGIWVDGYAAAVADLEAMLADASVKRSRAEIVAYMAGLLGEYRAHQREF
jgi:hypothetical protein